MAVRTMEILLEFLATILCVQKLSGIKVKLDIYLGVLFFVDFIILLMIDKGVLVPFWKTIIYFGIMVYIYRSLIKSWKTTTKIFTLVMLYMMIMQYSFYFILGAFHIPLGKMQFRGIIINFLTCVFLELWKEKYCIFICKWIKKLGKYGIIAVLIFSCIRLLYLSNRDEIVLAETIIHFCVQMLVLCLAIVMWRSSESESRHKEKELQMYRMYNQAFEETINTIRVRQHEFENHINAIKCMRYTIENHEELLLKQEQYCDAALKNNKIVRLLKLRMEPALIGFLYAKITSCEEKGIYVEYVINSIDLKGRIEVYEMIELIGVLFDNAVEALDNKEDRKIVLKLEDIKSGIRLEVCNLSRVYSYNELEKFCAHGYSTKGEDRGFGLTRVNEIVKKANATLLIRNKEYFEKNYLCFEVNIS